MEIDVVLIKSGHLFNAENRAEATAAARVLSRGDRGPAVVFLDGVPAEEYREGRKYAPGDYVHSRKARKAAAKKLKRAA